GEQVADAYLDRMLGRAESCGVVLVADSNSIFAGFVAGWIEQSQNIGQTLNSNRVGYISDVCVRYARLSRSPNRNPSPQGNRATSCQRWHRTHTDQFACRK